MENRTRVRAIVRAGRTVLGDAIEFVEDGGLSLPNNDGLVVGVYEGAALPDESGVMPAQQPRESVLVEHDLTLIAPAEARWLPIEQCARIAAALNGFEELGLVVRRLRNETGMPVDVDDADAGLELLIDMKNRMRERDVQGLLDRLERRSE